MLSVASALGILAFLIFSVRIYMSQPLYDDIDKTCRRTREQNLTLLDLNMLQIQLRTLRVEAHRRLRKRNKLHGKLIRAERRVERKLGEQLRQRSIES
jgi:hypothetical protein